MGGFSDEAIDGLEDSAELEQMSYHATEVAHLREVIDGQGRQIAVALTLLSEMKATVLALIDRARYYDEQPGAETLEEILECLTRTERTLK